MCRRSAPPARAPGRTQVIRFEAPTADIDGLRCPISVCALEEHGQFYLTHPPGEGLLIFGAKIAVPAGPPLDGFIITSADGRSATLYARNNNPIDRRLQQLLRGNGR